MQRKEAEKLLAALIFDDLDEASKKELLNYLQTDNELRERLADMRMAVKVASDTVKHGPEPVLGKRRLKHLAKLARQQSSWTMIFTAPRLAAAAAILIIGIMGLAMLLPSLEGASERGIPLATLTNKIEADYDERGERGSTSTWANSKVLTGPSSASRRFDQITSRGVPGRQAGQYAFEPPAQGPDVVDKGYAYDPTVRGPEVGESITGMYDNALIQKQALEHMINYRRQIEAYRKKSKEGIDVPRKTDEASIPYAGDITYPDRWQEIIASPYRKPEEPFGQGKYTYDPTVRGPEAVDVGAVTGLLPVTVTDLAFQDNSRNFIVDDFEKIGGEQTSTLGYANLPQKPDSVEKWASGSSFEGKPQSGVPISNGGSSDDAGEYRPWWAGDHGGGYGDKNGDGTISYFYPYYPGGGFGGMGGYGAYSGSGEGGGGIMAPSPGSGYAGMGAYGGGGYGGYGGGGYSSQGGDSGTGVDRSIDFSVGKTLNGVISGDTLVGTGGTVTGGGTYESDINWRGKEINLFTKPDVIGVVADGDSIAVGGGVEFQNGQAVVTTKDGSTVKITDSSFDVVSNDGAPSTVTVVGGQPVISTGPELTQPSKPTGGGAGISEKPGLKLKTESGESHLTAEDIKTNGWWAERRADAYDEVFKKADDELGTKSLHFHSDKSKPPVPDYGWVLEGGREGDVSRKADEAVIPYSVVKSSKDSEKYVADFLESADETKTLPGTTRSSGRESSAPAEGPADKEENGRGKVPILGDIPLVGGLYHADGKKRPLTEEEKKQIIAYLAHKKFQPQGESAGLEYETVKLNYLDPRKVEDSTGDGFRDLPGTEFLPGVAIELLPQDKKIIIFGSKEQREAVRNMIQEMDVPPGESTVDLGNIPTTGEDEPDLPPASRFKLVPVNPWVMAERDPLSTFALDVDTASYTLCRRYIRGGYLPPAGAVRMEEFINYFNYHYPQRTNPTFAVHAEAAPSPFAREEQNLTLLKIGVKARTIGRDQRKAAHLIFVVDASASMDQPDRLPLIQRALTLLVNKLSAVDRVSLITCANEARLHLESVPARERDRIRQAINAIQPAGPTNLLAGLKLGYATARRTFAPKQINHVVLCSDGVANVGQTEAEAVLNEVAEDRKQGITITCVGVGYGSYNDAFLEALANQGDGSYMFLDSLRQVHRVFVRQLAATLQTVARDARIQVDFNPNRVRRYRLIGYENRDIEDERFRDDTIDAGEVGSGQCSTALYELELIGQPSADRQEDLGTVFVRYRDVETGQFEEISSRLSSAIVRRLTVESAPRFFLAAGAARFAEILRQSEHAQDGNLMDVFRVVEQVSLALPLDRDVRELAELIRKSENLPRSP